MMSHSDSTGAVGYSFYLNLVVLDRLTSSSVEEESLPEDSEKVLTAEAEVISLEFDEDEDIDEEDDEKKDGDVVVIPLSSTTLVQKEKASDRLKKSMMDMERGTMELKYRMAEMGNSMRGDFKGFSKKPGKTGRLASAALRKTRLIKTRAALKKCLPEFAANLEKDLQLTIGKRFSQGKVTVLHVVLSGSSMPRYLEEIKGPDAAEKYTSVMSTLTDLGAQDSKKSLEREMLLEVKQGLMDKLSGLLVSTILEKDTGLEIECIALEEAEEAKWLFTFMEFQSQMKA
mmetsp:Transcript_9693/g.17640  ORF Transcript_9693/g.17640 Transcript_9693/m.17640 type:complete len:286 (-) Transcript_9693:266-1123(-)|eukprot:CAMPEP_0198293510 /NCGR_PEP_ID=MMETSP1449-20131203/17393_1 /TAXON_ID=420275 /ORGANISM="Attheya septentrionalis, Strain CCMP2084" /LENGTH=285 /DNA_ID=CAMNT_0043993103 /DNA_START=138 /DNA_END=995 /DNA_ORIENTATION=-